MNVFSPNQTHRTILAVAILLYLPLDTHFINIQLYADTIFSCFLVYYITKSVYILCK